MKGRQNREDTGELKIKRKVKRIVGWFWGERQKLSFEHMKRLICENAMIGGDSRFQCHISADASKVGIGGVVFQLPALPPRTIMERMLCLFHRD